MTKTHEPMDIDIVPIGPEAAAALAPLHAAAFVEAWNAAALARLLRADAARAFGAFSGYERTPLGFVLAFTAAGEAEILSMVVADRARRSGIGGQLLTALRLQLVDEGVTQLFLEVAADNTAAHGLYRRHGFVETGRRRGYYQRTGASAVDALTLGLTLAPPPEQDPGQPRPTLTKAPTAR